MTNGKGEASGWGQRNTLVYRGSSMYPTFRELDVLSYRDDRAPGAGDIIAFSSPGHDRITVHRVVRCDGQTFVTQGDNSPSPDPEPVPLSSVIGRIDSLNRDGVVRAVRGGDPGLAYAMGCHAFCRVRPLIMGLVGPVYRRLIIR